MEPACCFIVSATPSFWVWPTFISVRTRFPDSRNAPRRTESGHVQNGELEAGKIPLFEEQITWVVMEIGDY